MNFDHRIPRNWTCETVTIGGQKFVTCCLQLIFPSVCTAVRESSLSGGGYSSGGEANSSKYTPHYESKWAVLPIRILLFIPPARLRRWDAPGELYLYRLY